MTLCHPHTNGKKYTRMTFSKADVLWLANLVYSNCTSIVAQSRNSSICLRVERQLMQRKHAGTRSICPINFSLILLRFCCESIKFVITKLQVINMINALVIVYYTRKRWKEHEILRKIWRFSIRKEKIVTFSSLPKTHNRLEFAFIESFISITCVLRC